MVRMIGDDDVSAHPGMDFANDLYHAWSNQRLSAHLARVKPDIELRLAAGELSVRSMKDWIGVFEHHELSHACCEDMGNEAAS